MGTTYSGYDPWNPGTWNTNNGGTKNTNGINPYTGVPYANYINQPSSSSGSSGSSGATYGISPSTQYSDTQALINQLMTYGQSTPNLNLPQSVSDPLSLSQVAATNVDFPTMNYGISYSPWYDGIDLNAAAQNQAAGQAAAQQGSGQVNINTGIYPMGVPQAPTYGAMPQVAGMNAYSAAGAMPLAYQQAQGTQYNDLNNYYPQVANYNNSYNQAQTTSAVDWAKMFGDSQYLIDAANQGDTNAWMALLSSMGMA